MSNITGVLFYGVSGFKPQRIEFVPVPDFEMDGSAISMKYK